MFSSTSWRRAGALSKGAIVTARIEVNIKRWERCGQGYQKKSRPFAVVNSLHKINVQFTQRRTLRTYRNEGTRFNCAGLGPKRRGRPSVQVEGRCFFG